MKPLVIIKLGGSIVTEKDSLEPKTRVDVMNRLSQEVKEIIQDGYSVILVHGAGSFGHPLAKRYDLVNGMKTEEQKQGFCAMDAQMMQLNSVIATCLVKAGVPVISLTPRSFISSSKKEVAPFNLELIQTLLDQRLVPVLFGDGILDAEQGCSILSGDTIISYLAQKLQAQQVIFLSDVDGVFDSNPKGNPQAKLIAKINNDNFTEVLKGLTGHNKQDVTGEMEGKILSIKKNLPGFDVYIINGLQPDKLLKVIKGYPEGTLLHFD